MTRRFTLAGLALLALAPTAAAQRPRAYSFYAGPGLYPWGPFGYAGLFPGAYLDHWTNGRSLYGPPVRTNHPIPGYFSNDPYDYKGIAPYFHTFPHQAIRRKYGDRFGPHVDVRPPVPPPPAHAPAVPAAAAGMSLTVRLPQEAAAVRVNGTELTGPGRVREVQSPPLEQGRAYRYRVTAEWVTESGESVVRSRDVDGRVGDRLEVDFTGADEGGPGGN